MPKIDKEMQAKKLSENSIRDILLWYDQAVSRAEDVLKEDLANYRTRLENSLGSVSYVYHQVINEAIVKNNNSEKIKASDYLETTQLDSYVNTIASNVFSKKVQPLLDGLQQFVTHIAYMHPDIKDLAAAMAYEYKPRTMRDVCDQKLNESEIQLIVNWYEKLIDPKVIGRTDYMNQQKDILMSYLVDIPGVYFEMIDNAILAPQGQRKNALSYLNVDKFTAAHLDDDVARLAEHGDFDRFFYNLSEVNYEVKDVERAMEYHFEVAFRGGQEEIHSENVDYDKMNYLKAKRKDKEAFKAYLTDLTKTDFDKAAYLEKESKLWEKENEKLEKVTLDLFDAKHQSKILRQKRENDPLAFTKADQKALEKADKAKKDLNKKSEKIRDTMQKDYKKRLEKAGNPYPDVAKNRCAQIGFGDFRYMNRVSPQERTTEQASVHQPVNFKGAFAQSGVGSTKYTAQQVPDLQFNNKPKVEEKEDFELGSKS